MIMFLLVMMMVVVRSFHFVVLIILLLILRRKHFPRADVGSCCQRPHLCNVLHHHIQVGITIFTEYFSGGHYHFHGVIIIYFFHIILIIILYWFLIFLKLVSSLPQIWPQYTGKSLFRARIITIPCWSWFNFITWRFRTYKSFGKYDLMCDCVQCPLSTTWQFPGLCQWRTFVSPVWHILVMMEFFMIVIYDDDDDDEVEEEDEHEHEDEHRNHWISQKKLDG